MKILQDLQVINNLLNDLLNSAKPVKIVLTGIALFILTAFLVAVIT